MEKQSSLAKKKKETATRKNRKSETKQMDEREGKKAKGLAATIGLLEL